VPFDFLKRRKPAAVAPESASATQAAGAAGIPFDGMTEDWHLVGRMMIDGRMSDALNKREPIALEDVTWAPADGSAPMAPAPGLKSVDPYDLVLVLTSVDSLPGMTSDERNAHKVHKVSYEVALEAPPYRVVGTVYLYPGSEPDSLLQRSSDMFVPIVDASAFLGQTPIGPAPFATVLVNRQYLRGVEQVDVRTGERHEKLPGSSMGGTNWTDRSR
jgi:hypothetical protein